MLCRAVFNALLPPGTLWQPEEGEGLDNLLDGMAANHEDVRQFLHGLGRLRNPATTPFLADLEQEYGIVPTGDESLRRSRLAARVYAASNDGSPDFIQDILQAAGFAVYVHSNNPPVDPSLFILYTPSAICGNVAAICGASAAGAKRGDLLVNGPGDRDYYGATVPEPYWPLVFFVGGPVTRGVGGEITAIEDAVVPVDRKEEFANLILKLKPLHSWAGLRVQYA